MAKLKIAITGGIGSGKSLALGYIAQMGYPVFSCDEIYKEIINSPEYIKAIAQLFPSVIENQTISRAKLAKLIFDDHEKREQLNNIAHPMIMQKLHEQMNACDSILVFAEVPLLFECNFEKEFDKILYIYCDRKTRISNLISRDGLTKEEIEKRITAQFNPDTKEGAIRLNGCGAYIIQNNSTPEQLFESLSNLISNMKQLT